MEERWWKAIRDDNIPNRQGGDHIFIKESIPPERKTFAESRHRKVHIFCGPEHIHELELHSIQPNRSPSHTHSFSQNQTESQEISSQRKPLWWRVGYRWDDCLRKNNQSDLLTMILADISFFIYLMIFLPLQFGMDLVDNVRDNLIEC